jgi:hypothetical protein
MERGAKEDPLEIDLFTALATEDVPPHSDTRNCP